MGGSWLEFYCKYAFFGDVIRLIVAFGLMAVAAVVYTRGNRK